MKLLGIKNKDIKTLFLILVFIIIGLSLSDFLYFLFFGMGNNPSPIISIETFSTIIFAIILLFIFVIRTWTSVRNYWSDVHLRILQTKKRAVISAIAITSVIEFVLLIFDEGSRSATNIVATVSVLLPASLAMLYYFKSSMLEIRAKRIVSSGYIAIIGLSRVTESMLENELAKGTESILKKTLLIDLSTDENIREHLVQAGSAYLDGELLDDKILSLLSFKNMEKAVISLGDDLLNLEMAAKFIGQFSNSKYSNTSLRIIIDVQDPALHEFCYQNLARLKKADCLDKLEIQVFSFYKACVNKLFDEIYVDGPNCNVINSSTSYAIALVGRGHLFMEMFNKIAQLAHLPNGNILTVYIFDIDAESVVESIKLQYKGIEKFIELSAIPINPDKLSFYNSDEAISIWDNPALTRVILCDDNASKNISRAVQLSEKTSIVNDAKKLEQKLKKEKNFEEKEKIQMQISAESQKICCADFNGHIRSDLHGKKTSSSGGLFYVFAQKIPVCNRETVLYDHIIEISRKANYLYAIHKDSSKDWPLKSLTEIFSKKGTSADIEKEWYSSSQFNQLSTIAQIEHISVKLKALGLSFKKAVDISHSELIEMNQKLFGEKLGPFLTHINWQNKKNDNLVDELHLEPFLDDFEASLRKGFSKHQLFYKLVDSEHRRWMAFHYLHGWSHQDISEKDVIQKIHPCLKPLSDFSRKELEQNIVFDINSIRFIPHYLSLIDYQLVEISERQNIMN